MTRIGPVSRSQRSAGFTLVELLIGASLSAAVMAAVLSSYIFLGKSFTRLANQQTLENEGRRTIAAFAKDVQAATSITGSPGVGFVTFSVPGANGAITVSWNYDGTAGTVTRTASTGTSQILLRYVANGDFAIKYYDGSGKEYLSTTMDAGTYPRGDIKQLALEFGTQTGVSASGTLTPVYRVNSGRLVLHNSPLLQ